jgi:hypothetical protein
MSLPRPTGHCHSDPEGTFGRNQQLTGSMSLSPLYLSETSDLHVSTAFSPPGLFPDPSASCGKAHRFSGIPIPAVAGRLPGGPGGAESPRWKGPRGAPITGILLDAPSPFGKGMDLQGRETPRSVLQDGPLLPPRTSGFSPPKTGITSSRPGEACSDTV